MLSKKVSTSSCKVGGRAAFISAMIKSYSQLKSLLSNKEEGERRMPRSHRPSVRGKRYVVSSVHYLATMGGVRILESGGNAADAGVAVGICINVLQPGFTHFGGVAPIIYCPGAGAPVETISDLKLQVVPTPPKRRVCSLLGFKLMPCKSASKANLQKHGGFSLCNQCIRVDSIVFQVWSIFPLEGNLSPQPTFISPAILHSCQNADWSLNGVSNSIALNLHGLSGIHTRSIFHPL